MTGSQPQPAVGTATFVSSSTTRAQSISRWACVLVAGTALGIAGITARVVQLKVDPSEQLVGSMQDESGRLAQQRSIADALPRGVILDRLGRTLALDTFGGTLYVDVRDLYIDSIKRNEAVAKRRAAGKAREGDYITTDPIGDLAALVAPILDEPRDAVIARVLHRDPAAADFGRVPAALRTLPVVDGMTPELSDAQLAELPRYVVLEKAMDEDQIGLLRAAREGGGPTSIVRAAHFLPKQERVRPYGDVAAPIVGGVGIDVISDIPLAIDLRALYRDAFDFNREAAKQLAAGEDVRLIDDPVGEAGAVLGPILGMSAEEVAVAVLGAEAGLPEARLRNWAVATQSEHGAGDELDDAWLENIPTTVVVKAKTTAAERARFEEAATLVQAGDAATPGQPSGVFAHAALLPGQEGIVGRSGYERIANAQLSSKPGYTTFFAAPNGAVISIPPSGYRAGDEGDPVKLSIDIVIQELVESRVDDMVRAANASGGRALVINAHTGEILAAYSKINTRTGREPIAKDWGQDNPEFSRMRWATDPFEPGSIFKPFVWAWAVDHGFAKPAETIRLPDGPSVFADGRAKRTVREAAESSYGTKSWEQVLVKSVNAGMATVAFRMGNEEMKRCLETWRFGVSTQVGVENESRGLMPMKDEWSNKTRALTSVSFGQGIAVTPLQLAQAFSAFCRNGDMVQLSLQPLAPDSMTGGMHVLSSSAVRQSREAMQKVITEGTGKSMKKILHYTAFGKSGTAQLASPTGGYYGDKYLASFIAGAPYENPEIVVLVTIEDPDAKSKETGGATGGGALGGPVAAHIINDVLGYMGVPTDGELVYDEKKDTPAKKLAGR